MSANPRREPSADLRKAATAMFDMFNALVLEGFSEPQALVIIGQIIAGQRKDPQ